MFLLCPVVSSRLALPPRQPRLSRVSSAPSWFLLFAPKESLPSRTKPPPERLKPTCVTRAGVFSLLSVLSASLSPPLSFSVKKEHILPGRYLSASASGPFPRIRTSHASFTEHAVGFQTALRARTPLGTTRACAPSLRSAFCQDQFREHDRLDQHRSFCALAQRQPSSRVEVSSALCGRINAVSQRSPITSKQDIPPARRESAGQHGSLESVSLRTSTSSLRSRLCRPESSSRFSASPALVKNRVPVMEQNWRGDQRQQRGSFLTAQADRAKTGGERGGARDEQVEDRRKEEETFVDLRRLERFFFEGPPQSPPSFSSASSLASASSPLSASCSSLSSLSTADSLSPSSSPSPASSSFWAQPSSRPEAFFPKGRLFVLVLNRPLPAYAPHLLQSCDAYFVADGGGNFLYQLFQHQAEQDLEDRKECLSRRKDVLAARLSSQQLRIQEEMELHVSHQLEKDHQTLPEQREELRKLREQLSQDEEKDLNLPEMGHAGLRLEKLPEAICGDLDSLTEEAKKYFQRRHVEVIQWENQDLSDLEKAWKLLLEPKCFTRSDLVVILGAIGGRFDHSISAVHFLHKLGTTRERELRDVSEPGTLGKPVTKRSLSEPQSQPTLEMPQVFLVGEDSLCFLLPRGTTRVRLSPVLTTSHCALIPFGDSACNATTSGLRWNLKPGMRLKFGDFISTSNQVALQEEENPAEQGHSKHGRQAQDVEVCTDVPMLWYSQMRLQPSGELIPPLSPTEKS